MSGAELSSPAWWREAAERCRGNAAAYSEASDWRRWWLEEAARCEAEGRRAAEVEVRDVATWAEVLP